MAKPVPVPEDIENAEHAERVRRTIADRVALADDPEARFVPHDEVFADSRARLLARLKRQRDA